MIACYHQDIVFEDPAFGVLRGDRVGHMWRMLLSNKEAQLKVDYKNIIADNASGQADWTAEYLFGPKHRKVENHVHATFKITDGKIIHHSDHFNLWKWSKQA